MYLHPQFQTDVIKPLRIDELMDQEVQHLSGGELQRVAITMCLGKEADLYLIDEPSAYLDSEQRIIAAKVCYCMWCAAIVVVVVLGLSFPCVEASASVLAVCPCLMLIPVCMHATRPKW